jgi:hypothetical protein
MTPKSTKYPIGTSVAWTAHYERLKAAAADGVDNEAQMSDALYKIRYYEEREDVANRIEEVRILFVEPIQIPC